MEDKLVVEEDEAEDEVDPKDELVSNTIDSALETVPLLSSPALKLSVILILALLSASENQSSVLGW